jgi:hypothetical protein
MLINDFLFLSKSTQQHTTKQEIWTIIQDLYFFLYISHAESVLYFNPVTVNGQGFRRKHTEPLLWSSTLRPTWTWKCMNCLLLPFGDAENCRRAAKG